VHTSMVVTSTSEIENQGVTADGVITSRAPNSINNTLTLVSRANKLGTIREYFVVRPSTTYCRA
jgi:hypothetical protein